MSSLYRTVLTVLAGMTFPVMVTSCAVTKGDITQNLIGTDEIVTSSVSTATRVDGVDPSDAQAIKDTIVNLVGTGANPPAAWSNAETGASGTIESLKAFEGQHGQSCRSFKTSVSTYKGVSYFNGETCEISTGRWVLSWLKPVV